KDALYNSWTPTNTGATTPIVENVSNFSNNGVPNSYYLEDGSYIRLKSLILGYTIPSAKLSRIGLDKLRVYFQAANLFTITKYKGLDPELSGSNTAFGIDYGNYPNNQKNFNVGVNLSF
ncbi:MAG: TonB-dependent receptor plug, partial [Segetibacter sp.]|nr:TonB-dependent receptor plug [Segetibacter sp.]